MGNGCVKVSLTTPHPSTPPLSKMELGSLAGGNFPPYPPSPQPHWRDKAISMPWSLPWGIPNRWDSVSGFFSIFYLVWMVWSPPWGSQALLHRRWPQSCCRSWTSLSAHVEGPAVLTLSPPPLLCSGLPLSLFLFSLPVGPGQQRFFRAQTSERMMSCFFTF